MPRELNAEKLNKKFSALTRSKDSIQSLSTWIIGRRNFRDEIAEQWLSAVEKADINNRLTLFYLANDVLQNCKRRGAVEFRTSFAEVLEDALVYARGEGIKDEILRMITIWGERNVLSPGILQLLQEQVNKGNDGISQQTHSQSSTESPQPKLHLNDTDAVETFTPKNLLTCLEFLKRPPNDVFKKFHNNTEVLSKSEIEQLNFLDIRINANMPQMLNKLEQTVKLLEECLEDFNQDVEQNKSILKVFEMGKAFYAKQNEDVRRVAHAYKIFAKKLQAVKIGIKEKKKTFHLSVSSPILTSESAEESLSSAADKIVTTPKQHIIPSPNINTLKDESSPFPSQLSTRTTDSSDSKKKAGSESSSIPIREKVDKWLKSMSDLSDVTKSDLKSAYSSQNVTSSPKKQSAIVISLKQSVTSTPIKQNKTSTPIKQSVTPIPIKQGITSTPMKQSVTSTPMKQGVIPTPIKHSKTSTPIKQSVTSTPIKQSVTPTPIEQGITSTPIKQSATSTPIKQSVTLTPIKQDATSTPIKQSVTSIPIKQSITLTPIKQDATSTPINQSVQSESIVKEEEIKFEPKCVEENKEVNISYVKKNESFLESLQDETKSMIALLQKEFSKPPIEIKSDSNQDNLKIVTAAKKRKTNEVDNEQKQASLNGKEVNRHKTKIVEDKSANDIVIIDLVSPTKPEKEQIKDDITPNPGVDLKKPIVPLVQLKPEKIPLLEDVILILEPEKETEESNEKQTDVISPKEEAQLEKEAPPVFQVENEVMEHQLLESSQEVNETKQNDESCVTLEKSDNLENWSDNSVNNKINTEESINDKNVIDDNSQIQASSDSTCAEDSKIYDRNLSSKPPMNTEQCLSKSIRMLMQILSNKPKKGRTIFTDDTNQRIFPLGNVLKIVNHGLKRSLPHNDEYDVSKKHKLNNTAVNYLEVNANLASKNEEFETDINLEPMDMELDSDSEN